MTIRLEASARDAQRAPGEVQPLVYDSLFEEFGVWEFRGGDCNTSNRIRNPLVSNIYQAKAD